MGNTVKIGIVTTLVGVAAAVLLLGNRSPEGVTTGGDYSIVTSRIAPIYDPAYNLHPPSAGPVNERGRVVFHSGEGTWRGSLKPGATLELKATTRIEERSLRRPYTTRIVVHEVAEAPALTYEQFLDRVYSVFFVSAGPDLTKFRQLHGLPETGYRGFDTKHIAPAHAAGFRRFHIHLPDGFGPGDVMPFDARVDALDAGYRGAQDFGWLCAKYPDVVWLHYFGSMRDSDLKSRAADGRWGVWLDRLRRSTLHTLDLKNVEYAFDESVVLEGNSPEWAWLSLLRSIKATQGRDCFVESVPEANKRHSVGWHITARLDWWDKIQANPQWTWDVPLSELPANTRIHLIDIDHGGHGKMVDGRWVNFTDEERLKGVAGVIADVLARGDRYSIAVATWVLVERGTTARQLYDEVIRRMAE